MILDASFDSDLQAHVDQAISYGVERCVPLFDNTPIQPCKPRDHSPCCVRYPVR